MHEQEIGFHSEMGTLYTRIAGQNLGRVAALSDGVFAVAMTLLVLDLHVPEFESGHTVTSSDFWQMAQDLIPRVLPYFMSFLTLGTFWIGQQTQLDYFTHSDRNLTWIHFCYLLAVTLIPFSTSQLVEFGTLPEAVVLYWLNLLLLGLMLFVSRWYGVYAGLFSSDVPPAVLASLLRRIILAQTFYAVCMLVCFFNTQVSIALMILVQLHFAVGPPIYGLVRKLFGGKSATLPN